MAARLVLHTIENVDFVPVDQCVARVANLSAHLGIEWRLVENKVSVLLRFDHVHEFGVRSGSAIDFVADKVCGFGSSVAFSSASRT